MSEKNTQQNQNGAAALILMWIFVTPTVVLLSNVNAALFPDIPLWLESAISVAIIVPLISFVISPLINAILKRAERFPLVKTL